MSNSLSINSFKTDLLNDTGYGTWLNFYLNQERYAATEEGQHRYGYRQNDKYRSVDLPFPMTILESLVAEEFKMILEHLSCKTFDEFNRLVTRRTAFYEETTEPVNLVVRALDGSVYLRQYRVSEYSLQKLKTLSEKAHNYRSHQESALNGPIL